MLNWYRKHTMNHQTSNFINPNLNYIHIKSEQPNKKLCRRWQT